MSGTADRMAGCVVIDLGDFGGPLFIGREKGRWARQKAGLDTLDVTHQQVMVKVPMQTFALNPSFFLGMFGKSIQAAGSRAAFLAKYTFDGPAAQMESIEICIHRALLEKQLKLGGLRKAAAS